MAVDLQELLAGELAGDVRGGGRAHERFLQTLDRVYLNEYISTQDATAGNVADLNTASHVPGPQPWMVPTKVGP